MPEGPWPWLGPWPLASLQHLRLHRAASSPPLYVAIAQGHTFMREFTAKKPETRSDGAL